MQFTAVVKKLTWPCLPFVKFLGSNSLVVGSPPRPNVVPILLTGTESSMGPREPERRVGLVIEQCTMGL